MPENQVCEKTIRHRLATWYAHQLPQGHPLLELASRGVTNLKPGIIDHSHRVTYESLRQITTLGHPAPCL